MTRRISFFAPGSIISELALDTQVFAFNPKPARSASSALSGKKLASKPGKLAEIDNTSNNSVDPFTHDDDVVAQGLIGQVFASQLAQLIGDDVIAAAVSKGNKSPAALTGSINQAALAINAIQATIQPAKTLFVANDGINGPELWATDGTTAGTTLLKDIVTGANGSNPYALTSLGNGKAIFSATDEISGIELWVSDGSTAGTMLLKDIYAGASSSNPIGFTALGNGKALFSASDGINGQELWITDGTTAGTSLLKAISAPASGITAIGNGKAVFQENDAINGQELWISDGTTAGTTLFKDINVGALGSYASGFTTLGNGKAIFSATDGINGQELWITNGTTAGTTLLKDIYAGANFYGYAYSSSPAGFTAMGNGKIVFSASNGIYGEELWITDGTTAGTQLLKDIYPGAVDSLPTSFTALGNGKVIFNANDGINGQELWITDGTAAGTQLLKDIYAGAGSSLPSSFTALGNGKFLFIANDGISGQELWITDSTAAGTLLLKDIYPGAGDSMLVLNSIKVLGNGKATFSANDGINGQELWITDGTTAGTSLLKDINAVAGGSSPTGFTALGNGKDVFTARDASHGSELWITDGTTAGTALLKDIYTGVVDSSPAGFTALDNGKAIFSATDGISGQELWITDGTTIGTALLKDIYSGAVDSSPTGFTALGNGNVIFSATDDINGTEIWITDGTNAGTQLLKDINAGIVDSYATGFTALAIGKAIFSANNGINGQELWVTDGTTAGTTLLADINLGVSDSLLPFDFAALALGNGKAIFSANDGIKGQELWSTDGTTTGTKLLKDIFTGGADSSAIGFAALGNGKAIFSASDASHGNELWITDGTSAGTKLVKDIYSGVIDSSPAGFTALGNGKAIFTAIDDSHGNDLWVTDGTTAGTTLLKDIYPGDFDSYATGFTLLGNGKAIFSANDGINGQELWITDGTAAGTALLKDINAGAVDSSPADFSALGNGNAIFSANDGINGTELWITDGTTQGTQLLKDVNTATLSSNSSGFTKLLVNTLPTAANHLLATKVNVDHVFSLSEFAYSDQENQPLDHLVITSLPTVGTLYLDSNGNQAIDGGEVLAANTTVIVTDISHLSFKPDIGATGTPYANFGFKVNDGIADSALAYAMTVNVYNEQMVPGMTSGVIGDGNGDGVADITQANVESLQAIVQTDQANPVVIWATFAAPVDAVISNAKADASPAILPANAKMPLGVFNFDVNGIAVGASKAMSAYLTGNWQVQANGDWLDLSSNSVVNGYWLQTTIGTWHNAATQMVSDGGKLRIDFTLTDGDPISDADGLANGVIVDAGAPGNFTSMASVSTLGNAPLQISRANPNAWSNAWTAIDASISHKADIISGVETWSNVSLNSLASTTLVGGDLYAGDLGVSGQSLATSSVRQEIDGSEALRFNFTHLVTDASVTLSRLFAQDDGLIGNNEAGRLQAYNGTTLVADQVFQGDSSDGQKLIMLDVIQGFDSLVFTAGAFDSQNQFISGGYRNDAGQFATAPFSDTSLHGSDYLIHTLLIGVKPAEFPL